MQISQTRPDSGGFVGFFLMLAAAGAVSMWIAWPENYTLESLSWAAVFFGLEAFIFNAVATTRAPPSE